MFFTEAKISRLSWIASHRSLNTARHDGMADQAVRLADHVALGITCDAAEHAARIGKPALEVGLGNDDIVIVKRFRAASARSLSAHS